MEKEQTLIQCKFCGWWLDLEGKCTNPDCSANFRLALVPEGIPAWKWRLLTWGDNALTWLLTRLGLLDWYLDKVQPRQDEVLRQYRE